MRSFGPVVLGAALLGACDETRPPRAGDYVLTGDEPDAAFFEPREAGPPPADAPGLCGNLVIPLVIERPNLYFIVDASGSMSELMDAPNADGFLPTRYQAARFAIAEVLRIIGHRVSFGAALFPGRDATDEECTPGEEVFPTIAGDPESFALSQEDGPILTALLLTFARHAPSGPTPTAESLRALAPTLLSLPGETYVFLLTDGAPNCNIAARCAADQCGPNIEGTCPLNVNCCDPAAGLLDYRACIDAEPTVSAVRDLAEQGIPTFVVGLPGTAYYADLLSDLAVAGNTARPVAPYYYPVASATELGQTLKELGTSVAIECAIALEEAPPEPALVNVYFHDTVVPLDEQDGWRWVDATHIEIVGPHCDLLKNGDVLRVQVVAGCPTILR
jgi:hypothetical protein